MWEVETDNRVEFRFFNFYEGFQCIGLTSSRVSQKWILELWEKYVKVEGLEIGKIHITIRNFEIKTPIPVKRNPGK